MKLPLKNIINGEIASEQVNVDEVIPIGLENPTGMTREDTNINTLKKKTTAVTTRVQSVSSKTAQC